MENILPKAENSIRILTLNLHCYQEQDQLNKFKAIAQTIQDFQIDIMNFQEVGERIEWDGSDNSAKIIKDYSSEICEKPFDYYWEMAHYGFDVYKEGIAIITHFPILEREQMRMHNSRLQRNIIHCKLDTHLGKFNMFCTHLAGFYDQNYARTVQTKEIVDFVRKKKNDEVVGSVIAGDFNTPPNTEPYNVIIDNGFIDTLDDDKVYTYIQPDYKGRFDYIFFDSDSNLEIIETQIVFNGENRMRVSDHLGVMSTFKLKS